MSLEQNKALVRRFLDEVIGRGDLEAADGLCAADLAWHGVGVGELADLAAFKRAVAPFLTAFPDLSVTAEDLLAEGDRVVARYTWRGTQRGEFFGIPATGRSVEVAGTSIYRLAGGKIVEEWWLEDLLGLMQQLGASGGQASA
ncbi:MAG TPA: ester cyclase [Chloroflexota bacterium]